MKFTLHLSKTEFHLSEIEFHLISENNLPPRNY